MMNNTQVISTLLDQMETQISKRYLSLSISAFETERAQLALTLPWKVCPTLSCEISIDLYPNKGNLVALTVD